jgi:hypothetical protein
MKQRQTATKRAQLETHLMQRDANLKPTDKSVGCSVPNTHPPSAAPPLSSLLPRVDARPHPTATALKQNIVKSALGIPQLDVVDGLQAPCIQLLAGAGGQDLCWISDLSWAPIK